MRVMGLLLLATCLAATSPRDASAQKAVTRPTETALSTRSGVYTAEQAERGRVTYAGLCRSCHTPASHTGATFEKWWKGRTLADLFGYMSAQMPKNTPGSMNPDEYADVVAYILKLNAMPAGNTELPTDSASLAAVRIETQKKPARSAPTGTSKTRPSPVKTED